MQWSLEFDTSLVYQGHIAYTNHVRSTLTSDFSQSQGELGGDLDDQLDFHRRLARKFCSANSNTRMTTSVSEH